MSSLTCTLLTTLLFSLITSGAFAQTMSIDARKSTIQWTGSKVVGSKHTGKVKVKSGKFVVKNGDPTMAEVVVDMSSITNEDLKEAKWNKKLVNHLKSDDFFSVDKFPTAKIALNRFVRNKDGSYQMAGKITIKGQTKPVKLLGTLSKTGGKVRGIKTIFNFDRTEYGIRYGSGKFFQNLGDKMISDEVSVAVDLALKS